MRILLLLAFTLMARAQFAPLSTKSVGVYGQSIVYHEAGAPTGPVVVLLHGLGGDMGNWAFTVPALASKYRVIVPDQIGFGASSKPVLNYRVQTMVDFLDAFLKKLGVTKATLVGNSLGGWIAASYALTNPEKVDRIVLVDAAGVDLGKAQARRDEMPDLNPSTLAGYRKLMETILHNKAVLTDQFIENGFTAAVSKGHGQTINAFLQSILRGEDSLDGKLAQIKAPALIVWGREDLLTELSMGETFKAGIPRSELKVLDGCGHVPQMECAPAFNAALTGWLPK